MTRLTEFLGRYAVFVLIGVVACAIVASAAIYIGTRSSESVYTPANVALLYADGATGMKLTIGEATDVSVELGAVEAYKYTLTAPDGTTGDIVVAKTSDGTWVVVQPAG